MNYRDTLIAWLNDAYAMELALIPVLKNHAQDAEAYPAVSARLLEHVEETQQQAERVRVCLQELGEEPSTAKSALGKIFGTLHAPGTGMYSDELVKNALMDFATEAFEMACYEALAVAAMDAGHSRIADLCRQNFAEEEHFAQWLREQLPETVRAYCESEASEATTTNH